MKMKFFAFSVLAAFAIGTGLPGLAGAQQDQGSPLQVGDKAPDFTIPGTVPIPAGGNTVGISAITDQGKSVVLAFFPKAFTGG